MKESRAELVEQEFGRATDMYKRAILDVTCNVGGKDLADALFPEVSKKNKPPFEELQELEAQFPGAKKKVSERMRQISKEVYRDDLRRTRERVPVLNTAWLISEYGPYKEKKRIRDVFKRK